MPRSYWSVKKYGSRWYSSPASSRLRAATLPCSIAVSQCSTRIRRPRTGCWWLATSPAAQTRGSLVRSVASVSTPLSTARPARSARPVAGLDADPHDEQVALDDRAVAQRQAYAAIRRRRDVLDLGVEPEVHAVRAMQVGEDLRDPGTDHPEQRQRGRLDHGHRAAGRRGGGGHLEPDPAGPDDDDPAALDQRGAQGTAVVEGAQVGDRRAAVVRGVEPARGGAGGDQEPVEPVRPGRAW